ncbi:MAG: arsenite methyltransferase [Firmicutes bacterium]|nr:arsenite methyltransferase [Bacillota bacterium]
MAGSMKEAIKERYGRLAGRLDDSCRSGCAPRCGCAADYSPEDLLAVPEHLVSTSLGCGNPLIMADLKPGDTVLDLGSGAGLDVLLAARRVAPDGWVYGLDMTEGMLALARRNQVAAGITNAEFLHGDLERIPLPAGSVDVVISNCVINLATDKPRALTEAHRVLKPGGRVSISDTVWLSEVPEWIRQNTGLWAACIAGAMCRDEYTSLLGRTGFSDIDVTVTRIFDITGADQASGPEDIRAKLAPLANSLASALIRARKPV